MLRGSTRFHVHDKNQSWNIFQIPRLRESATFKFKIVW